MVYTKNLFFKNIYSHYSRIDHRAAYKTLARPSGKRAKNARKVVMSPNPTLSQGQG